MSKRLRTYDLYYIKYADGSYGYRAGMYHNSLLSKVIAVFRVTIKEHKISKYHMAHAVNKTNKALQEHLLPKEVTGMEYAISAFEAVSALEQPLTWHCDLRSEECAYNIFGCEACTIKSDS